MIEAPAKHLYTAREFKKKSLYPFFFIFSSSECFRANWLLSPGRAINLHRVFRK